MILDDYYTTNSAAEFLGISELTIRILTRDGKLSPTRVGTSNLYHEQDLKACKGEWYADGLSHRDISEKYDKRRTTVIYHFRRLKVKPTGVDGRRKGRPAVYDQDIVGKFAKILGWEPI